MKIFVYDEFNPEDMAMMQALYSRSAASVVEHVEKVRVTGSGKFMEKYYIGYGHSSIADCGSTTIFIENVSMLAAKAIQDWPLYSGQETSSRYIDLSRQPLLNPAANSAGQAILDRWLEFYTREQSAVADFIRLRYPRDTDENEETYERAVKARIFDSLRGFLPAGTTTQLSWHTNLRQAWDKLALLRHWPLPEVVELAEEILRELQIKYRSSFGHPANPAQEKYRAKMMKKYAYYQAVPPPNDFRARTSVPPSALTPHRAILQTRPSKTNLPHILSELGQCTFEFPLDFGSFRDLQRHRHGVCRMPLLTTKHGFHPWYLEQLPRASRERAQKLISEQKKAIAKLKLAPQLKQYYAAMGFVVICRVTYGLPAAVYVTELRSGRLVHPTLRRVAHQMDKFLRRRFPILKLHSDTSPDDWDIRRGQQDIREK